jgi:DNA-binding GntR family transcriptional regulator
VPDPDPLAPVSRATTVRAQVYSRLRQAIGDGLLAPGSPLASTDLSERLGVSRTPVREAIARLVQDGLALEVENGQVIVRPVMREEIAAFFELRAALESLAARRLAERDDRAALAELEEREATLERRLGEGAPTDEQRRLNDDFHLALYDGSGNPLLRSVVGNLQALTTRNLVERLYERADADMTVRDHRAIISALRARDAEAAAVAARTHVERSGAYLVGLLADAGPDASG